MTKYICSKGKIIKREMYSLKRKYISSKGNILIQQGIKSICSKGNIHIQKEHKLIQKKIYQFKIFKKEKLHIFDRDNEKGMFKMSCLMLVFIFIQGCRLPKCDKNVNEVK